MLYICRRNFLIWGSGGQVTENLKRVTLTAGENRITVKHPKEALAIAKLTLYEEK